MTIIVLKTKKACQAVLDSLLANIKRYGFSTVADLKNLIDQDVTYLDQKCGWFDLSDASISRTKNNWSLILPESKDL